MESLPEVRQKFVTKMCGMSSSIDSQRDVKNLSQEIVFAFGCSEIIELQPIIAKYFGLIMDSVLEEADGGKIRFRDSFLNGEIANMNHLRDQIFGLYDILKKDDLVSWKAHTKMPKHYGRKELESAEIDGKLSLEDEENVKKQLTKMEVKVGRGFGKMLRIRSKEDERKSYSELIRKHFQVR